MVTRAETFIECGRSSPSTPSPAGGARTLQDPIVVIPARAVLDKTKGQKASGLAARGNVIDIAGLSGHMQVSRHMGQGFWQRSLAAPA